MVCESYFDTMRSLCGKRHHKYRPADLHPMVNLHGGRQRSLLGCGVPPTAPGDDTGTPRAPASPLGRRSCKRESSDRSGNHHVLSVSRRQRLGKKIYMGSASARAPGKFVSNYPNLEERGILRCSGSSRL